MFKSRFNAIDKLASAYYESNDTGSEQKRLLTEAKSVIEDFGSNSSVVEMKSILNATKDNIMQHFDEDFPKLSSSQRTLALYIFCGLSLTAISVFMDTDIRNLYVYKSRLKSTISKSCSPRKPEYLSYFG